MKGNPYLSGILIVDKPVGMTSHQVVQVLRRLARQRRVGHGGTLDPLASGVLPLLLGYATRVAEYILGIKKRYRAHIRLGASTDTYDAEGEISSSHPTDHLTREAVERALVSFQGEIQQLPPMHSALKHEGKPLYSWARAGVTVERRPRAVTIYRLDLVEWNNPELLVDLECSRGTYVRVLAHDLGQALECGGYLAGLRRLACGHFTLEEALSLAKVEEIARRGAWGEVLHPLDEALRGLAAMTVDEEGEERIRQGRKVPGPELSSPCLAYSPQGHFIAILTRAQAGLWQPHKVFPAGLFPPSRRFQR